MIRRATLRCLATALAGPLLAATLLSAPVGHQRAAAEEVRIEHVGLSLVGNFERPADRRLGEGPAALIVHGSLAHHGMEIVAILQRGLRERGFASLAITLSLGLDARRGMLDCALEHDHRASDAGPEIAAWTAWLEAQGASDIALVGHSRGAEQVIRHAASPDRSQRVSRSVLIAPPADTPAETARRYGEAHGGDLADLIARARKLAADGDEDTVLDAPGFLHCKGARVTAGAFLDYYDGEEAQSALALLARLDMPLLVIAGSADQITPAVAERVAALPKRPNVEVAVIDGADHFFRDLSADDLADRVAQFLK